MHIGGIQYEIQDIRAEIRRKPDSHELHAIRDNVDRLERSLREFSAANDGFLLRLQEMEERIRQIEQERECF